MGAYIDGSLRTGENIRHEAHLSLWSLASGFVMGTGALILSVAVIPLLASESMRVIGNIASAILVVVGVLTLVQTLAKYYTTELAVTNKRVIAKTGWVSRKTIELLIHKVESIQVLQPATQRMFGYGSVVISAAGEENAVISGISNPMEFRDQYYAAEENMNAESHETIDRRGEAAAGTRNTGIVESV